MNRYFSSFLATILLYTALISFILINLSEISASKKKPTIIHKFRIVEQRIKEKKTEHKKPKPKPEPKQKPKLKPKPTPKPKLKQKNKPAIKPKLKSKPKIEPKTKKQKVATEKLTKPKVIKKTKKTIISKSLSEDKYKTKKIAIDKKVKKPLIDNEMEEKRAQFIKKIKTRINKNKFYPKTAMRRHIQGDIKVKFIVQEDGNVRDIMFLSGKRIFKKAITRSINDSFPIKVDSKLFNFPKEFTITIRFQLR